jgi:hypothetical protein
MSSGDVHVSGVRGLLALEIELELKNEARRKVGRTDERRIIYSGMGE